MEKNNEVTDLLKTMNEMGISKFRQIFGQEIIEQLKEVVEKEKRLVPIRERIRLQSKLKGDFPMCEKCQYWGGVSGPKAKPCPYDKEYEKNIIFGTNEISQNPFPTEVCEKFVFAKEGSKKA